MAKAKTGREALAQELRSLIPKLDGEGLAFLVEQAKVHLYNMEADRLNRAAADLDETRSRKKPASGAKAPAPFRIEGGENGSSYYIVYNNEWILFTREEMGRLAGIVNAQAEDLEIRERLFNWLKRERGDMLIAAYIKDKFDDKLKILTALIKKTFKARKR